MINTQNPAAAVQRSEALRILKTMREEGTNCLGMLMVLLGLRAGLKTQPELVRYADDPPAHHISRAIYTLFDMALISKERQPRICHWQLTPTGKKWADILEGKKKTMKEPKKGDLIVILLGLRKLGLNNLSFVMVLLATYHGAALLNEVQHYTGLSAACCKGALDLLVKFDLATIEKKPRSAALLYRLNDQGKKLAQRFESGPKVKTNEH